MQKDTITVDVKQVDRDAMVRFSRLQCPSVFAAHRIAAEAAKDAEIAALQARVAELERAARDIMPYLEFTISDESLGHHPTMPSAVAAFQSAFVKEPTQ